MPLFSLSLFFGGGDQGRGQFFVQGKEEFNALPVVIERLRPIAEVNRTIERRVSLDQRRWHRQRVVKIRQRRVRKLISRASYFFLGALGTVSGYVTSPSLKVISNIAFFSTQVKGMFLR